ncbi:hypothetical protein JYU34_018189 [Plutella xylostella]|uniref:Uncharacterized protein n=1 Tax=Plutella xylostella TaxID=51655 RepID=A0ABQ7Q061_PLUXY|nr:hypothetical protein JYU34_018189 [Plutella xylostella]
MTHCTAEIGNTTVPSKELGENVKSYPLFLSNSASSPGKAPSSFQMAPGGERKPSLASWTPEEQADTTPDDLQRRLDHLRGFL